MNGCLFKFRGRGDQIYVCKTDGAESKWVLKAPDAKLF